MSFTPTVGMITNMNSEFQRNAEELFTTFSEALYQKRVRFRQVVQEPYDYVGDIPELLDFPRSLHVKTLFLHESDYVEFGFPFRSWARDVNASYFGLLHKILLSIQTMRMRMMRMNDEDVKLRLNISLGVHSGKNKLEYLIGEMRRAPNLGSIELSSTSLVPFDNVYFEEEERELVATSMTWLKMRFFQLKCAMIFDNDFTDFVRRIMTRFHEGTDSMHAVGGIIQMQVQMLLLFANGRFERAYQLARQSAEALNVFLLGDSTQLPPYKEEISIIRKAASVCQVMGGSELSSIYKNLFPLNDRTHLDKIFNVIGNRTIVLQPGTTWFRDSWISEFRKVLFASLNTSVLKYVEMVRTEYQRKSHLYIFRGMLHHILKKEYQRKTQTRFNITKTIFKQQQNYLKRAPFSSSLPASSLPASSLPASSKPWPIRKTYR